jgi:hypothetical protein
MVRTIEWTSDTLDGPYPVDARSGLAFGRLADGSLLVQEISKLPTPGFGYKLVLFSDYYNYRFAAITPATVQAKPAD